LVWSLPQALLSAELSLMVNVNGGNVIWVQRAFGDFVGWVNAYNGMICSFSSMACLVVLFVEYIPIEFTAIQSWGIKLSFITFITLLNILGLRWISRLSVLFIIFILSPFLAEGILFFTGGYYKTFDAHQYLYVPRLWKINWGLLLSTAIWSYGGFDSMGSLAGEVKGGRPTFIKGIFGSMPLIMINYYFPILIGYGISSDYTQWIDGYFTQIPYLINNWLGPWMVAASALSNFGQYNAAMAPLARVVWAMAKDHHGLQKLPTFLSWSWRRHTGTVRPVAAIIFTGIMTGVFVAIPFDLLVQMFLILRIVNLFCEYTALIKLRYSEPETPRPFVVPGGLVGAYLLGVPTLILSVVSLVYAPRVVWIFGLSVNSAILVAYFITIFVIYQRKKRMHHKEEQEALIN